MLASVVIVTYRREQVLLETIRYLHALLPPPAEVLIVDQSEQHESATNAALESWHQKGQIRWIKLSRPSVTHAMNTGLLEARNEIVIFVDDDIIPDADLLASHISAQTDGLANIVAGQVLQPGEERLPYLAEGDQFKFCSSQRRWVRELIGCNFSVKKFTAIALGGFDENFLHVAYRFESEFCDRALSAGERILFEPTASIRHLKASAGGTRSFGEHLTTVKPSHTVGAYYYLLRGRNVEKRFLQLILRPLRAVRTKHHLRRPWWIPMTLAAEFGGFIWAVSLFLRGPALIQK